MRVGVIALAIMVGGLQAASAQTSRFTLPPTPTELAATSTDLFIMTGSDLARPGLHPRSNLNIGVGHTFDMDKRACVLGCEFTFSYAYENAGSHGWLHSGMGSHTEALGLMRAIPLHGRWGAYTWLQSGLTSVTGGGAAARVQNRSYWSGSLGLTTRVDRRGHQSIWWQASWSKVATIEGYPTLGIGWTGSW